MSDSGTQVEEARGSEALAASGGASVLNLMAIPLGTVGLAGVWQTMAESESAPSWVALSLFTLSAALWIILTISYLITGQRRHSFAADRENAFFGPFAAYIPVIGILLCAHYESSARDVGKAGVLLFTTALALLTAQLLAHWLRGNVVLAAFHPGYFLPTVAGPFIASIGLAVSGWLVLGGLLFGRLFTGPPLPDPLKPTLALLVSAPATAGLAWIALSAGQPNVFGYGLLGVMALMVLVQVMLLSEYLMLGFVPSFWAFTFPVATATNLVIHWLHMVNTPHHALWSWVLAGLTSVFVASIAAATVAGRIRTASGRSPRRRGVPGPAARRHEQKSVPAVPENVSSTSHP